MFLASGVQLQTPSGDETAPPYSFISDPHMGLFRTGADELGIATAGIERVHVDAAGRVGIGADPVFDVHVLRASAVVLGLETQAADQAVRAVFRSPPAATAQHRIEFGDGDDFDIGQRGASRHRHGGS